MTPGHHDPGRNPRSERRLARKALRSPGSGECPAHSGNDPILENSVVRENISIKVSRGHPQ